MNEKRMSVFKLCTQNHAAMAALFVCLCMMIMVSLNRLLYPFFRNEVITSAYESIKNIEPRIITEILANRFGEASEIIETDILHDSNLSGDLNLYSIQNYDVYGLIHTCPSKIAIYNWGAVCVNGQNYSIEVPIKSADNTLAHVTVRLRQTINSWMPYKILQYCLWATIFATTALTLLLIKRVHRRIILPIERAVHCIEDADIGQDFDYILSQIPLKELHCVASHLFQKQQLLGKLQIENIDLQAKTKMTAIVTAVAHDIRSPLSSLKAAAEMLRKHVAGNGDAMDAINLLQLSSQRLEGIANGLLTKHKSAESGQQVFSIHEMLDELVGELQASPIGNGVKFKKQYHSGALYISGDKTGMARAFGNIIKNALEAMEGNGGDRVRCLMVGTALVSPPPQPSPLKGEGVVVRITDTGPGIAAEKIPLILEGGHTEGKENGHGIGTKVVREVIDAHKGTLTIESEVGRGTTFMITLPLSAPIEDTATRTTVTIPYSGSGTVHVIDDEPSMREQWRLTLKAQGVAAEMYASWEDFSSHHPRSVSASAGGDPEVGFNPGPPLSLVAHCGGDGVFIIDYHFDNSEVDGLEIIRRLKERGFSTFVLATAEYWKPAIKAAAVELGITICPKPLPRVVVQVCHPDLPCHPSVATLPQNDNIDEIATSLQAAPRNDMTGPSVLVIDDDSTIHLSWRLMRTTLGVGTVTTHNNLEEMIAAATNPAKFDLCVIDKNIEGSQFDGARTLEYLRQNGARTVVLATGETGDDIRKDPRFNSADGILKSKVPMTPEELELFLN